MFVTAQKMVHNIFRLLFLPYQATCTTQTKNDANVANQKNRNTLREFEQLS